MTEILALIVALSFLIGIANRIRGGAVFDGKNRIFGGFVVMAILMVTTLNPIVAICTAIGYYIGSTWGWGVAVGSTAGLERKELVEWPILDKIVSFFVKPPKRLEDGSGYDNIVRLRTWGTVWLTLRGAWWGVWVSLGYIAALLIEGATGALILSIYPLFLIPVVLFGCMGVCFLTISLLLKNNDMWEKSELLYGYVQGLALAALILL